MLVYREELKYDIRKNHTYRVSSWYLLGVLVYRRWEL